jgi:ATP-binding cassette, subfamily C, bacterial CydD
VLLAVILAGSAAAYGGEAAALRAAAQVKSQLRRKLIGHCLGLGPPGSRSIPGYWADR